jgi:hypothetical protein
MFMMVANLIGYAVGLDGILDMISKMNSVEGIAVLLFLLATLFGGAHRMFYYHGSTTVKKNQ